MHQEAKHVQMTEEQVNQLGFMLKRLFSLPIKRSTLRELHGILMRFARGNEAQFKEMFEAFLLGQPVNPANKELNTLIKEYSPLVRLAREVHDRGEFLGFITSDILSFQDNKPVLSNLFRNIDGTETHFITDVPTTLQMILHFVNRLQEIAKNEAGKASVKEQKEAIAQLKMFSDSLQKEIS